MKGINYNAYKSAQSTLDDLFLDDLDEDTNIMFMDNFLDDFPLKEELVLTVKIDVECHYVNNFGIYIGEVELAKKDKESLFVHQSKKRITLKGSFVKPLKIGYTYYVRGVVDDYKGETQLYVKQSFGNRPVSEKGMLSYLKTLNGINKKAEDIFKVFGMESIDALLTKPKEVVNKVNGVGIKTVEKCKHQLLEFEENQITIISLIELGLNEEEANGLVKLYGATVLDKIHISPYELMHCPIKISFKKCDKMAFELGFDMTKPERLRIGLLEVFSEISGLGHTCYPYQYDKDNIILDNNGFVYLANKFLSINLNHKTMIKLFEKKSTSYTVGERNYPIDLNKLGNCLKKYDALKYQKEDALYPIVDVDYNTIIENINELLIEKQLIINKNNLITTKKYFKYESNIKDAILKKAQGTLLPYEISDLLGEYLSRNNIELETAQIQAVKDITAYDGGFFILNGSAGCGKTFTLKIILDILEKVYSKPKKPYNVRIFAPTGKAAKVASLSTNRECITIHRGLEYQQGQFQYNKSNPLKCDCIVIDESSMLDVELSYCLLQAIQESTKIIFVGDVKQLPSVGPGSVLKDIIDSGQVVINTLTVPKRQKENSGIYDNATKIIEKNMIETSKTNDFYVLNRTTDESILSGIVETIERLIKKDMNIEEIQVLTPQKTTKLGVEYLNYHLQNIFNPLKQSDLEVFKKTIEIEGQKYKMNFRIGDKVIHIRNNYEAIWYVMENERLTPTSRLGINNGETGVIQFIQERDAIVDGRFKTITEVIVKYDDEYIVYRDNFTELELAYALTIHKSQGSGWDNVIIPVTPKHSYMWDNNLLYTAVTRARQMVALLGSRATIYQAIQSDKSKRRNTNLPAFLK